MEIVTLTPDNITEHGLFCAKNPSSDTFKAKAEWYKKSYANGLRLDICYSDEGTQTGFIEYMPIEEAWRPVSGADMAFITCLWVYPNKFHGQGYSTVLLNQVEGYAKERGWKGMCVFSSQGPWIATQKVYQKHGFLKHAKMGRFELMVKSWDDEATLPEFINWEEQDIPETGWHLYFGNQCPYHQKAAEDLEKTAKTLGITLTLHHLHTAKEAQKSPSGFGSFALVKDGHLLEDHYISKTRFKNIVAQQQKKG